MTEKPELPKDLGVKMGTPEEAFWRTLKESTKENTLQLKRQIEVNNNLIMYAVKRIAEEKAKFK